MQADAGMRLSKLRVGGGVTQNDLLMQFQANLLGVPVVQPQVIETTALGAAYLAGLGVGYWRDRLRIDAQWQSECIFKPAMARQEAQCLLLQWRRALARAADWAPQGEQKI